MLSRRSILIRLGLCVLLGAVTTWMVAWGCAIAVVFDYWSPPALSRVAFAADAHQHTTLSEYRTLGWRTLFFHLQPIPQFAEQDILLLSVRTCADMESAPIPPKIPDGIDDRLEYILASGRVRTDSRRADAAAEFLASARTGVFTADWQSSLTEWHAGLPWPSLRSRTISGRGRIDQWSVELPSINGSGPVRVPLRPIWSGLVANTAFYGAVWSLPIFGLPLLKQARRRREGRCPRCAYDLKRDLEQGCPECGWRRRGETHS